MTTETDMLWDEASVEWAAKCIDGVWCVGMKGNLDTIYDATVRVTGGFLTVEEAGRVAQSIADQHNSALSRPASAPEGVMEALAERLANDFEAREIAEQHNADQFADMEPEVQEYWRCLARAALRKE